MVLTRVLVQSCRAFKQSLFHNQGVSNVTVNTCRFIRLSSWNLAQRLYTSKHEWIEMNGKVGTVGISQYASESLGDVVYAQLPDIGTQLKKQDECGALESVKAASEIYSPVSGKILEKNNAVEDTPALINTSCYEKGWLFKVELENEADLKDLMTEEQYKEFLKTDEH